MHQSHLSDRPVIAREYLRVSKDRLGSGKSPDQQHAENAKAVKNRGWILHADPYRDDDRSASRYARKEREDFRRLTDDLENGCFDADYLVIWESSRGSRRTGEWVNLIELCEERQVRIFVTTHGRDYDPANARDRRSMLEDAVDSEYESAKTSERIRRNVRAAAEEGRVHGRNLYGYLRIYDPYTRELLRVEEHPEQAPVVKEAAQRVLSGETFYAIARDFNSRGIPPRSRTYKEHRSRLGWTPPAVKAMLTTASYAGKREHLGEIVADAQWPAIIDPEVWSNELMPLIASRVTGTGEAWPTRHLLAGIALCDVCGGPTRAGKQNVGGKRPIRPDGTRAPAKGYGMYMCVGVAGKTGFHVAMKESHLDTIVTELLLARLEQPDFLLSIDEDQGQVNAERRVLLDELAACRTYLDEVRALSAERLNPGMLVAQLDIINPRIALAQRKLDQLSRADPCVIELASASDVRAAWEQTTLGQKRRILRCVMRPRIKRAAKPGSRGLDLDRVVPGWL